jgi:hypothetical protein
LLTELNPKTCAKDMAHSTKKRHLVYSTDYDGSGEVVFSDQFPEEYFSNHLSKLKKFSKFKNVDQVKDFLARGKKKYLSYLNSKRTSDTLSVKVLNGSLRQDHQTDQHNYKNYHNGLCLENLPKLCKDNGWEFIPLLYPDVLMNNGIVDEKLEQKIGNTLANPEITVLTLENTWSKGEKKKIAAKIYDKLYDNYYEKHGEEIPYNEELEKQIDDKANTLFTKSQFLMAQMQYISLLHKGEETDFYFLDDNKKILAHLEEYFRQPGQLPPGINLVLVHHSFLTEQLEERCRLSYSSKLTPQRAALETLGFEVAAPIGYAGAAFFMAVAIRHFVQEKSLADTGQIVFNFLTENKNQVITGASFYIFLAIVLAFIAMQQAKYPTYCGPTAVNLPEEKTAPTLVRQ